GTKAECPPFSVRMAARVSHVVDRKHRPRVSPERVPASFLGKLNGSKAAVPVVQMQYLGSGTDAFQQHESGVIEEGEAFVLFGIDVDRISMKVRRSVDEERRRTIRFAVKRLCGVNAATPIDIQVFDRSVPKILAFRLQITRRYQDRINANGLQCLWQSTGHVTKPTCLGVWDRFSRNDRNTHN